MTGDRVTMERENYFRAIYGRRDPVLDAGLRRSLLGEKLPPMQVDDATARLLSLLTALTGARRIIELGGFVGYSAIHIARALPPEGLLTTLEIDPNIAEQARHNITEAGLGDRVEVLVVDALEYLANRPDASADMIFVDAEKAAYPDYLKASVRVLSPGGLLVADDCYPDGDYAAEDGKNESDGTNAAQARAVAAINSFNLAVARSRHFQSALVSTSRGLMLARRSDTM